MTRYVLCTVVTYYTRTHARTPHRCPFRSLARHQTQPNARAPAPARCSNDDPEASIHGRCIGLAVAPSLPPSVGGGSAGSSVPPLMAQKMRQHRGHGALELRQGWGRKEPREYACDTQPRDASTPFFIHLWMIFRVFRFGSCYIDCLLSFSAGICSTF